MKYCLILFFSQLTSEISHLRVGLLVEGFSRPQSEPDVDEMVKKSAEQLAIKTGASLQNISVPMHLDCKCCLVTHTLCTPVHSMNILNSSTV